jgi:A/G-specific adenine glycosylase
MPKRQHTPPAPPIQKPKQRAATRLAPKLAASEPVLRPEASDPLLSPDLAQRVRRNLLTWYDKARRALPWREYSDPYAIWVSEVMLQQTQVQTVKPYYERWMTSFPTLGALARASEAEVLQHWQGLGYYSRARNLHRGAQVLATKGGELPRDVAGLRALPGVGAYTAGAIASIALGLDEPAIDGNIARVLSRLFALAGDLAREPHKRQLWALARNLLPRGRAGDFNQALMELGALCCTPKKPMCADCPLKSSCRAHAAGEPTRYPTATIKPKLTDVQTVAALVERKGRLLLMQLPTNAPRWGGLWVFPNGEVDAKRGPEESARRHLAECSGLECKVEAALHRLRHHITRYRIDLTLYRCLAQGRPSARGPSARLEWVKLSEIREFAMPAPHQKLAAWLARTSAE